MYNDLFNLLKKDHQEVMDLLDQIKELSDRSYKKREELFAQVKQELVPHLRAEEKAFYSLLQKEEQSKEDAMEAMEEHHAAELVMAELEKMSTQEEFWPAKLSVFKEMVHHHIEEEESKIFQDTREVIDEEQIGTIVENFENEKEKIKAKAATRSRP